MPGGVGPAGHHGRVHVARGTLLLHRSTRLTLTLIRPTLASTHIKLLTGTQKKKNWDWFNAHLAGLQLLLESLDAPLLFLNSLLCNSKSGLEIQLRIIAPPPTQPLLHFHFLVLKNSHFYTFTFWY